jgi:Family of unknown function (DUF6263)
MFSFGLRLTCLAALGSALTGAAPAEAPITLHFHPAKGSVTHLQATFDQKLTQGKEDSVITYNQTLSLGYTFTTQAIAPNGVVTVKVTYDSVKFKQESPQGTFEYDSTKPPPTVNTMARAFVALPGQSVTLEVKPDGHVSAVHGQKEMIDAILTKLDLPEGVEKANVEKMLRSEYSEKAIKDDMETMLLIYPDHPVLVGDHWVRHMQLAKVVPMTLYNTFTLKDVTNGTATLDVKSTLATDATTKPLDLGNQHLRYHLSGEQNGLMKLNLDDGVVRSAEITQNISGTISMESDTATTKPAATPLSVETKISLEAK